MDVLDRFPDYEAVDLMRRIGIRYVVLHTGRAAELANRVIRAGPIKFTRVISSTDGDYLYEIAR
jgi:hypothetical protein